MTKKESENFGEWAEYRKGFIADLLEKNIDPLTGNEMRESARESWERASLYWDLFENYLPIEIRNRPLPPSITMSDIQSTIETSEDYNRLLVYANYVISLVVFEKVKKL